MSIKSSEIYEQPGGSDVRYLCTSSVVIVVVFTEKSEHM